MQVVQEPNKHAGLVGFFQQLLGGILQQQERKRKTADLMDIGNWAQGGFEGEAPKTRTDFGRDFTAKLMDPLYQQNLELAKGKTAFYKTGRARKPTKDEVRFWLDRGYSVKDAVKKARGAAEISAGFKPRATSRTGEKRFDIKTLNDTLWKYTDGHTKEPSKQDLFALKEMLRGSGYKLRKITVQEAKTKKFIGIDRLWPDQKQKKGWVIQSGTGEIIAPSQGEEKASGSGFENSVRAQSAPAVELDDIWALLDIEQKQEAWALNDYWEDLNEEERATAKKHILNGGKAEDIIRLLSGE